MTEDWKTLVLKKQAEVSSQIPSAWRLPAEYTDISETTNKNVLDIPRRCGILSQKQLDITENYDATSNAGGGGGGSLIYLLAAREVCNYYININNTLRAVFTAG